jgi:NADH-quinone oxidoreductase subunit A
METTTTSHLWEYLPIIVLGIVAAGFVVTTMVLTHMVGPKRKTKIKNEAFELSLIHI